MGVNRRDFIKQAAFLSGVGAMTAWPESIKRALAIEPEPGSSYLDAEHIVILMQENRSFDHTFGTLQGVRGYGDPRAIRLADGCPVWAQADSKGRRYLPFRMDIRGTKATWMGSLPHSWPNQVDARNNGQYNRWLDVKDSGDKAYADMPLTLGYYTRDDIPFYYALADAFTVCDQNFCSSLTGTTPNRLHLWTGTTRAEQSKDSKANVLNSDVDYGRWAKWRTFPELLEDLGVSWRVYQNEVSIPSGMHGEHHAWLAGFEDNPLEWFTQFGVQFAPKRMEYVKSQMESIGAEIEGLREKVGGPHVTKRLGELTSALADLKAEASAYSKERFDALPERAKRLHERAFTSNAGDPDYRELAELVYRDGDMERRMQVPKGDPLFQFRKDVEEGKLPAVSWLVPSERFSDHPSSAWYGAWYLSETIDILTKNPEVWKKTVFILTYDENDGYFDHAPPFVAPHPDEARTGRVSKGIDASLEFVKLEQDKVWHSGEARQSPIGLGYRVPMVIASPWSRGGAVCSQVFDHTSVIRFIEKVLSKRLGKPVRETNISSWRRAVCGDLTSAFREAEMYPVGLKPLNSKEFLPRIHQAQFKDAPRDYRELSYEEVASLRARPGKSELLPKQEPGQRPSCPLPYELFVTGGLNAARDAVVVTFEARRELFKDRAAGAPFTVYAVTGAGKFECRDYAVEAGERVEDSWKLSEFEGGVYHLRVHGPNGMYWELKGDGKDPGVRVSLEAPQSDPFGPRLRADMITTRLKVSVEGSKLTTGARVVVSDVSYATGGETIHLSAGGTSGAGISTGTSGGWYDVLVRVEDINDAGNFSRRFAGRMETGQWSVTDPLIGA